MLNGNWLFDRRVNGFLSKMDDSTSMVSLALRDGAESSGRTLMEYKRDKHGGRERLIEEVVTMLIWGFGIGLMKKLYDALARNLGKLELPDLDTTLLKQGVTKPPGGFSGFFTPAANQVLNPDSATLRKLMAKYPQHYGKLREVMGNTGKQALYRTSSMIKFLFATGIPVLAIAVGIPKFNQWLTSHKVSEEKKARQQADASQGNLWRGLPMAWPSTPVPGNATTQRISSQPPALFSPTKATNAVRWPAASVALGSTRLSPPPAATTYGTNGNRPFYPSGSPVAPPVNYAGPPGLVKFGFSVGKLGNLAGDTASNILQNDRINTLLVDGTISGGRIIQARNWQERLEIAFREGSIILFLYWAQRAIQDKMTRWMGGHSDLAFNASRQLKETYGNRPEAFQQAFRQRNAIFKSTLADFAKTHGLNVAKPAEKAQAQQKLEQALVEQVQQYFLHDKTDDLIFETAKKCGWIPTFEDRTSQSARSLGKRLKDPLRFLFGKEEPSLASAPKRLLDLTKKIDTEAIFSFSEQAGRLHAGLQKGEGALLELLQKSVSRRGGAWLLSNAVCTVFLSYICPKLQHYMTYKMTGKKYFPGLVSP